MEQSLLSPISFFLLQGSLNSISKKYFNFCVKYLGIKKILVYLAQNWVRSASASYQAIFDYVPVNERAESL